MKAGRKPLPRVRIVKGGLEMLPKEREILNSLIEGIAPEDIGIDRQLSANSIYQHINRAKNRNGCLTTWQLIGKHAVEVAGRKAHSGSKV